MLSPDPIKRGLNPYPYCDNDPVNYVDPTGEIANILAGAGIGGLLGGASGFLGNAVSQIGSGRKFDWRKAAGAAANGAVVGAAKGALIGSGAGIPLAFATDFAAGSIGNALEQRITTGRVDLGESLISGTSNAVSELLYGTGKLTSAKDAFIRGAKTGAVMSGFDNITRAAGLRGAGRDPKGMCGSPDPFDLASGLGNGRGYHGGRHHGGGGRSRTGEGSGFSLGGFVKDVLTGAVVGGLSSAGFYGVGKAVERLKWSVNDNLTIMSRNSSRGNPSAITHFDVELNTRQNNLLRQLPNFDSSVVVNKGAVNLHDLAALTAKTGDEFAMFTRGSQRMIIRGNSQMVNIDKRMAQELYNAGFKWSGHTHPGEGINVRIASDGDLYILKQFKQKRSAILDSQGKIGLFEIGG